MTAKGMAGKTVRFPLIVQRRSTNPMGTAVVKKVSPALNLLAASRVREQLKPLLLQPLGRQQSDRGLLQGLEWWGISFPIKMVHGIVLGTVPAASFEQQHPQPRLCQLHGGKAAARTGAHDYDIKRLLNHKCADSSPYALQQSEAVEHTPPRYSPELKSSNASSPPW